MKLCVLSTILLSCFAFYNASTIRPTRSIATISIKNTCDVYLAINFMLIVIKLGVIEDNVLTNEDTPLGYLLRQIDIQQDSGLSIVWNPSSANVIFMMQTTELYAIYKNIKITFSMNSVDWNVFFNEIIGVNNIPMSQKTIELFKYLAQILSTALGVNTQPKAVLNLYALIVIPKAMSGKDCGTTTFSPIGELAYITDNKLLAKEIARCSLIIDAATYYNSKFQFSNCACLLHTCSGYATSPIIGDSTLIESLEHAIFGLLNIYTNEEILYILIRVFIEHAVKCDVGETLSYIFQDQNLLASGYVSDDEPEVHSNNNVKTEDKEKCLKAPVIEEVTTVTAFVAVTQNSTDRVEFVEEPETTTEEVTTKKPRIFVDTSDETPKEEVTTPMVTISKTDNEATMAITTTDAPTTTTTTTLAPITTTLAPTTTTLAPTTTTLAPTTTENTTTNPDEKTTVGSDESTTAPS